MFGIYICFCPVHGKRRRNRRNHAAYVRASSWPLSFIFSRRDTRLQVICSLVSSIVAVCMSLAQLCSAALPFTAMVATHRLSRPTQCIEALETVSKRRRAAKQSLALSIARDFDAVIDEEVESVISINSDCNTPLDSPRALPAEVIVNFECCHLGAGRVGDLCEYLLDFPFSFARIFWQHDTSGYLERQKIFMDGEPGCNEPPGKAVFIGDMKHCDYFRRPCPHFILAHICKFMVYTECARLPKLTTHMSGLGLSLQSRLLLSTNRLRSWPRWNRYCCFQFCLCSECYTESNFSTLDDRSTHTGISFLHYWARSNWCLNPTLPILSVG